MRPATIVIPAEDLKMLRETLCVAQHNLVDRWGRERIGELIAQIDRHRPLGNDGKHGDRHTMTCGCLDKPLCVHCKEPIGSRDYVGGKDWVHCTGLQRCQKKDVPYGHLAHPAHVPCRADGPNPCLGAFPHCPHGYGPGDHHYEGGCR